ncbi:hypothetical protein, partial [Moorena sp. SIO4E2]
GALTVVELNSPRVAPLHRFASILVHCSGDPLFPVPDNCREVYCKVLCKHSAVSYQLMRYAHAT